MSIIETTCIRLSVITSAKAFSILLGIILGPGVLLLRRWVSIAPISSRVTTSKTVTRALVGYTW